MTQELSSTIKPEGEVPISLWPECPQCKKKRLAVCPGCGEASEEFPLADYQEEGLALQPTRKKDREEAKLQANYPLLECPICSEVFRPQFYRVCAWCGFQFQDGKKMDLKGFYLQIERRPAIVMLILLIVGILFFGYFFWLFS